MKRDKALTLLKGGPAGVAEWNSRRADDEAIPSLAGANLSEADLWGANLTYADLTCADLTRVNLAEANLSNANLTDAVLMDALLSGAVLMDALLSGANLMGADLTNANLTRAILRTVLLRHANLTRAALSGADLRCANLASANLTDANLSGANLNDSNLTHANLTRASLYRASLYRASLPYALLTRANLAHGTLGKARLMDVDLTGADLTATSLLDALLTNADLTDAGLTNANLRGANLRGADLARAHLTGADLTDVNLSGANLQHANLARANLTNANLTNAKLQGTVCNSVHLEDTICVNVDLTALCAADDVKHSGRSSVDWLSIARSLTAPGLERFLIETGMPEAYVTYAIDSLRSLDPMELLCLMQSTMISYGGEDEAFAKQLHEVLQRNGVPTWFFPKHAEPGKRLGHTMRDAVHDYDRMILICSQSSLQRPGVLNEITQALEKEAANNGQATLIPIRLDDAVFSDDWASHDPGMAREVQQRVVADFRGADTDPTKFQDGVMQLLAVLKKPIIRK